MVSVKKRTITSKTAKDCRQSLRIDPTILAGSSSKQKLLDTRKK